jgi:glucose/arabinose dehydrogenase
VVAVAGTALVLAVLVSCSGQHPESAGSSSIPPGAFPVVRVGSKSADTGATSLGDHLLRATRVAKLGEMATGLISDPARDALFVTTRAGRILRIPVRSHDGVDVPVVDDATVAVDLTNLVSTGGERGLLSLEVVDDGHAVAVSYTARDGAVTVRLLRLSGSRLVDDVHDPTVLSLPHPYSGHNGGGLASLGNGDLLLSLGDMDSDEFPQPYAQDPASPLGSVLRLPADALSLDGDRPIAADPSLVVAKGLRNPWRIGVDPTDDTLWIGDVGEDRWEEIDRLPTVSSTSGVTNFGWPTYEGDEPLRTQVAIAAGEMPVGPVFRYAHGDDRCAIALGGVYRGRAIPALDGAVVYGDFCSGEVSAIRLDDHGVVEGPTVVAKLHAAGVVSVDADQRGELYVLTAEGDVYRLDPADWRAPDVTAEIPTKPSGDTSTTSTTVVEVSQPECLLARRLVALSGFQRLTPQQLESGLTGLQTAATAAVDAAPPSRRDAISTLSRTLAAFDAVARSAGFDATAPAVTQFYDELGQGVGRGTGFPDAVNTVVGLLPGCPSD